MAESDLSVMFLMHITDGYSFRNMMNIIKSETDHATMILSPDTIEISFINTQKCAVHKIVINPKELTKYEYNIFNDDNTLLPEYPIGFDTNEMFNTTKGVGRRDGIRLYWIEGDNKINIQPIKGAVKDPGRVGASFVKILNIEHMRYGVADSVEEPNVRVQAKDLADICGQASTLKCSRLDITGKTNEIIMRGMYPNNTEASVNKFTGHVDARSTFAAGGHKLASNISSIDDLLRQMRVSDAPVQSGINLNIVQKDHIQRVSVPIATVKALSKIHNISPAGTLIRFYFSKSEPIKLESPIGTYGVYTVCLR